MKGNKYLLAFGLILGLGKGMFSPGGTGYLPEEILVKFKPEVSLKEVKALNYAWATLDLARIPRIGVWRIKIPPGTEVSEMVEKYKGFPGVEYAEPNYLRYVVGVPNDSSYSSQWALSKIEAEDAWGVRTRDKDIIVAVLDTGVDLNHPDLSGRLVPGYDFVNNDSDPSDDYGHGTHCAGIIAAQANNSIGIAGLSWKSKIMPVKVLSAAGSGSVEGVASGIIYAADKGARVISLSLGSYGYSSTENEAVNYAYDKGCLVIGAAGNDSVSQAHYPAAYEKALAVSATNENDKITWYSNFGSYIEVSAPGGEMSYLHDPGGIYSTMPTYPVTMNSYGYSRNYDYLQGTSMACPYVAGLAAFILSRNPNLSNERIRTIIRESAKDLGASGFDHLYGYGRIDAFQGVDLVPLVLGIEEVEGVINFPNPFRPSRDDKVTISFPPDLEVTVKIYNLAGELVRNLEEEGSEVRPEKGEAYWDGKNEGGDRASSGLYIYLLKGEEVKATGKITVIK
jgi:subtilisin family serine protease